jgi:hypothetical protein
MFSLYSTESPKLGEPLGLRLPGFSFDPQMRTLMLSGRD